MTDDLNIAAMELSTHVGQIVSGRLWRILLAECAWRHAGRWQLSAVPIGPDSYLVNRMVCAREERRSPKVYPDRSFRGPQEAQAWGVEQGCFLDLVHAAQAYDLVKSENAPKDASTMWRLWVRYVEDRKE
jgi:hypothetical protein